MQKVARVAGRLFIVFGCAAIVALPLGEVLNISNIETAVFAGLAAVSLIIQKLAKAYVTDGKLTNTEIDDAFSTFGSDDSEENQT